MKKILLAGVLGLACGFVSAGDKTENKKITLVAVSKSEDGGYIFKSYASDDLLTVNYSYAENIASDSVYNTIMHVSFDENTLDLIPVDVMKTGFVVAGDLDLNVRKFGITKNPSTGCSYEGVAVVKLHNMMLAVPEYPAGYNYTAKVQDVISATPPKLKCE